MYISSSLEYNLAEIKKTFGKYNTVQYRQFVTKNDDGISCSTVFIKDIAKKEDISNFIISPVMGVTRKDVPEGRKSSDILFSHIVAYSDLEKVFTMDTVINALLNGDTILLIDGCDEALSVKTSDWKTRSVTEPESEKVVRGPKEGFTESLSVNIALLRRKIKSPDLRFIHTEVGVISKTDIAVCYIKGIASEKILEEVLLRLDKIDIDAILDSGYIEELIKDAPFSMFNTVGYTERPDVAIGKLLEGRIVIICDGTPFALTVPFLFAEYFQAAEDYYNNYTYASINRFLRWIGCFLSTSVPAIYVAFVTFHQELLPTPLLLSISAARQGVPFPTIVEATFMLIVFEILREAGIRIPTPVGQAISIVGALVIGQSAVEARLVSAPIIIVAALSGITSFLVPKMEGVLIVTKLALLFAAAVIGLYGYLFSVIAIVLYMMSLRSFGVPYLLSVGSTSFQGQKDMLIRAPWKLMYSRPKLIAANKKRKSLTDDNKGI